MYYRERVYKYYNLQFVRTKKTEILPRLLQESGNPSSVEYHKNSVTLYYWGKKYQTAYTVPVDVWEQIKQERSIRK